MKEFQNTRDMVAYIQRNMKANPGVSFERIFKEMWERWDTVWWLSIKDVVNWKEWWYEEVASACNSGNSIDFSKYDDDIFSTEEPAPSFQDTIKWEDWDDKNNVQKIEVIVNEYNKILNDIKKLVDDNNSWQWLSDKQLAKYKKELADKKQQLKDIEDSEEFYNLMVDLAKRWTWKFLTDEWLLSPKINWTLDLIAWGSYSWWKWSDLFSDTDMLKNWSDFLTNTFFDRAAYATFNSTTTPQDIAKEFLSKWWNKNGGNKWWSSSKLWDLWTWYDQDSDTETFGYKKRPKMANKEVANEMSFGDDVSWKWWNDYLTERNKTLALHLKLRWLETPEQINAYLEQYPSWKNAKQERKDNTIKVLSEQMSTMISKRDVEKMNEENKKKEKEMQDARVQEIINDMRNKNNYDQTPENNEYLRIDEEVKNLDDNRSRVQYLVDKWFRINDEWYWEKDGVKTRVYQDGIYDKDLEHMSSPSKTDIRLQEAWYDWPRNEKWHFIPKDDEYIAKEKEEEEKKKAEEEAKKKEQREKSMWYNWKKITWWFSYNWKLYNEYSDWTIWLADERNPSKEKIKITGWFEYNWIPYNEYSDNTFGPASEWEPEKKKTTWWYSEKWKIYEEYSDWTYGEAWSKDIALKRKIKNWWTPSNDDSINWEEEDWNWPKLDMNDDILNWAWDIDKKWNETPKPKSNPNPKIPTIKNTVIKKSKKETEKKEDIKKEDTKKEDKKFTINDIKKAIESSPTIMNLLKKAKK